MDLESQLSGVAHHEHMDLTIDRLQLLESGDDEHCGLAHSRLRLAQDVASEDRLGNGLMLHWNGEGDYAMKR